MGFSAIGIEGVESAFASEGTEEEHPWKSRHTGSVGKVAPGKRLSGKIFWEFHSGRSFGKAPDLPEWKAMAIPKGTWAKYGAGIEDSEQQTYLSWRQGQGQMAMETEAIC